MFLTYGLTKKIKKAKQPSHNNFGIKTLAKICKLYYFRTCYPQRRHLCLLLSPQSLVGWSLCKHRTVKGKHTNEGFIIFPSFDSNATDAPYLHFFVHSKIIIHLYILECRTIKLQSLYFSVGGAGIGPSYSNPIKNILQLVKMRDYSSALPLDQQCGGLLSMYNSLWVVCHKETARPHQKKDYTVPSLPSGPVPFPTANERNIFGVTQKNVFAGP